jgi:glyceraldehyde-3-phosphate dehydrogenase/erythrose-4-phosphate dehydrogenase
MPARIGINGFGRMEGRLALRVSWPSESLQTTRINEIAGNVNCDVNRLIDLTKKVASRLEP